MKGLTGNKDRVTQTRLTSQIQQLLAIEWRPAGAAVLAMAKQRDQWPIAYEFECKWTDEAMAAGSERKAAELCKFIVEKNLVGKPDTTAITFSLDPALVISKRFDLPLLRDDAIFDAVALELESRGLSSSEHISDYVVHRLDSENRMVISTISAPHELLEPIKQIAERVGCTLCGIGLGEYGFVAASAPLSSNETSKPTTTAAWHLLADRMFMQLILTNQCRPLAEFRFPYPGNPSIVPKLVAASLERLVQALPGAMSSSETKRLVILGEQAQVVAATLRNTEFSTIEPRLANAPSRHWRAWGSALQFIHNLETFDLHRPKRGVDHQAVKQKKRIRIAVWAATMLALLGYSIVEYHRQLDHRTRELQLQLSRMEGAIEQERPTIEAANQLADWERLPLHLTAQLTEVLRQLPDHDRVFLTSLQVDQGDEEQADVKFEGLARQLDDALEIPQRLIQSGFELRPHRIDHNDADPHYRTRFTVTAKLESDDAEKNQQGDDASLQLTSKELP